MSSHLMGIKGEGCTNKVWEQFVVAFSMSNMEFTLDLFRNWESGLMDNGTPTFIL